MYSKVILHLARSAEYPVGSSLHGYELTIPLDEAGYLDAARWRDQRALCRVRRFWDGEADRIGYLVHRSGGAEGATWVIDYDRTSSDDDESGYRLSSHRWHVGDYISIQDPGGHLQTFEVAQVSRL